MSASDSETPFDYKEHDKEPDMDREGGPEAAEGEGDDKRNPDIIDVNRFAMKTLGDQLMLRPYEYLQKNETGAWMSKRRLADDEMYLKAYLVNRIGVEALQKGWLNLDNQYNMVACKVAGGEVDDGSCERYDPKDILLTTHLKITKETTVRDRNNRRNATPAKKTVNIYHSIFSQEAMQRMISPTGVDEESRTAVNINDILDDCRKNQYLKNIMKALESRLMYALHTCTFIETLYDIAGAVQTEMNRLTGYEIYVIAVYLLMSILPALKFKDDLLKDRIECIRVDGADDAKKVMRNIHRLILLMVRKSVQDTASVGLQFKGLFEDILAEMIRYNERVSGLNRDMIRRNIDTDAVLKHMSADPADVINQGKVNIMVYIPSSGTVRSQYGKISYDKDVIPLLDDLFRTLYTQQGEGKTATYEPHKRLGMVYLCFEDTATRNDIMIKRRGMKNMVKSLFDSATGLAGMNTSFTEQVLAIPKCINGHVTILSASDSVIRMTFGSYFNIVNEMIHNVSTDAVDLLHTIDVGEVINGHVKDVILRMVQHMIAADDGTAIDVGRLYQTLLNRLVVSVTSNTRLMTSHCIWNPKLCRQMNFHIPIVSNIIHESHVPLYLQSSAEIYNALTSYMNYTCKHYLFGAYEGIDVSQPCMLLNEMLPVYTHVMLPFSVRCQYVINFMQQHGCKPYQHMLVDRADAWKDGGTAVAAIYANTLLRSIIEPTPLDPSFKFIHHDIPVNIIINRPYFKDDQGDLISGRTNVKLSVFMNGYSHYRMAEMFLLTHRKEPGVFWVDGRPPKVEPVELVKHVDIADDVVKIDKHQATYNETEDFKGIVNGMVEVTPDNYEDPYHIEADQVRNRQDFMTDMREDLTAYVNTDGVPEPLKEAYEINTNYLMFGANGMSGGDNTNPSSNDAISAEIDKGTILRYIIIATVIVLLIIATVKVVSSIMDDVAAEKEQYKYRSKKHVRTASKGTSSK